MTSDSTPAPGPGKDPRGPLTDDELRHSLDGVPPILGVDQAARLLGVARSTLYHQVSRGRYRGAVKRGRPLLFFRDRLVREAFRPRR